MTFTDINANLPGVDPGAVIWRDYDGDGDLDLLLYGSDNSRDNDLVKLYDNDGSGGFSEDTSFNLTGIFINSLTTEDYDGDGDLDFLLHGYESNYNSSSFNSIVKLYDNDGNGGFREDTSFNLTDIFITSLTTEDYDGDGDLDLILHGYDDNIRNYITKLYENNGFGSFSEDTSFNFTGLNIDLLAMEDYDGDGDLDILLREYEYGSTNSIVKFYENDDSGGFNEYTSFKLTGISIYSLATEDYDGDGDLDLLLREYDYISYNLIVKLYENDGSGGFREDTSFFNSTSLYTDLLATEDYDGDGDLDFLLREYGYGNSDSIFKLYDNDGSGGLSEDTSLNLTDISIYWIETEDYDGDGDLDIFLRGYDYGSSSDITKLYESDDSGGFREDTSFNLGDIYIHSLTTEDYDGDGDLDIFLSGYEYSNRNHITKLYENDGSGSFSEDTSFNLTDISLDSLAMEDYDGDGDLDIFLSGYDYSSRNHVTKLYDNDGSGGFREDTSAQLKLTGIFIDSLTTEDYDGDGDLDLLITGRDSNYNPIIKIYRNDTSLPGSNILKGTAAAETLNGGQGNDRLLGLEGNDSLYGGNGHDTLEGGIGDDNLHGWSGDDLLKGGDGADILLGQDDNDFIKGGNDHDFLTGDRGADTLHGEGGNDTIWGWDDDDLITGGAGADIVRGHLGNDLLNGNEDNDSLSGDIGNDTLNGASGNDNLRGWTGDDALNGGDGKDLLVGHADNDRLTGGEGDDSLYGGDGHDTLDGSEGNDALYGNGGMDIFAVKLDSGRDFIADFVDGVDKFGLSDGLTFEELNIVPSGNDSLIKDLGNNQLAIVKGLTATDITVDDFS